MDLVLVGLPGSGKSAVGRRVARLHGATFVDLDERIEAAAGRPIPAIFTGEGEIGFRHRERDAVRDLGPADPDVELRRVIATGGGTPIDPRNRWLLYRGRVAVWLDGPPEVLAQRLHRSPTVRPLVAGRDPIGTLRQLAAARARFYAPAVHLNGIVPLPSVVETIERHVADGIPAATSLLLAETAIGRIEIGVGIAGRAIARELERLEARRAIVLTEPGAWSACGPATERALRDAGFAVEVVLLPRGERAKRLAVVERIARALTRLRVERGEPIVAVGGGALGDTAGFVAATYLRGVPIIHVPTTLVAQIDAAIGGKTAVDLPEGKNLVGAFHQPTAIVVDTASLVTLPTRQRRAALGEAVKMAALGDERLLELLESDGVAIARGEAAPDDAGAVAELVERAAWAKIEVVLADEREAAGRITLNLGHSVGHAIEAATGYRRILHGEAVAYGLRAALRIGLELGVTPVDRAQRIEELLTRLGLALGAPGPSGPAITGALGADKKHEGGRLRWVLPTATGVTIRSDVPDELVARTIDALASAGSAMIAR